MKVEGIVKEGTSKNGNAYIYLEIKLSNTYVKKVFLDKAEVELLKLTYNQK